MRKHFILPTIILFCFCNTLIAQHGGYKKQAPSIKGKIVGQLIDSLSNNPVEFATAVLIDAKSKKEVNGVISNEKGQFKLENVKVGTYTLVFSFLGYNTKTLNNIAITLKKPDVNLKEVFLLSSSVDLDEVTVTAEASLVENKIDKIVYNAEQDVANKGGDATDVLRRVPLLSVDLDGNLSLRGSSNIRILINGKPSGMFAGSVADALKSIPATQIKNVEVITTPTAKYDGEGSAGIVNIITKKKNIEGFSGSLNTSVGTRQNNGSLNLNIGKGRFGMNFNGSSYYSWPREGYSTFYREDQIQNVTRILQQDGINDGNRLGFNGSAGAFYEFNAYNYLSTSFRTRGHRSTSDRFIDAIFDNPLDSIYQEYSRVQNNTSLYSGYDWTTDYTKTFKTKGQELSFGVLVIGNIHDQDNSILQTDDLGNAPELGRDEKNMNRGRNVETTLQGDYTHPFNENVKMEIGAKAVLRNINSDYDYFTSDGTTYINDPTLSDIFQYNQNVYAGYASFNFKIGENYGLIAGGRYEQTDIQGEYRESAREPFTNNYNNFLPSVIIQRKFKNFRTLKLAYSKRIQRPSLFYINPYAQIADNRNITFGNPTLAPELSNTFELSYNMFVKGVVLNGSAYYRYTTDVIESFLTVDDNGASVTTFQNIGTNNSFGFNFFGSATIKKIWTLRTSFDIYSYNLTATVDGQELSNQAFVWKGHLSSTIKLGKTWKAEIFSFFNSPRRTLQGYNPSFSMKSFGIQKDIWDKRGQIGIRIVEPFEENKSFASELQGSTFHQTSDYVIPFRSFGLNFTYRFGKLNFKAQNRKSKVKNDDLKQDGGSGF